MGMDSENCLLSKRSHLPSALQRTDKLLPKCVFQMEPPFLRLHLRSVSVADVQEGSASAAAEESRMLKQAQMLRLQRKLTERNQTLPQRKRRTTLPRLRQALKKRRKPLSENTRTPAIHFAQKIKNNQT